MIDWEAESLGSLNQQERTMKSRLALLATPFLALACSDGEQATLLEPPSISADVTAEAQPVVGDFTNTVA